MAGKGRQSVGIALPTFGGILCVASTVALLWAGLAFTQAAQGAYPVDRDGLAEVVGVVALVAAGALLMGALLASVGAGAWAHGRATERAAVEDAAAA